jgi:hypothetical protein
MIDVEVLAQPVTEAPEARVDEAIRQAFLAYWSSLMPFMARGPAIGETRATCTALMQIALLTGGSRYVR